MSNNKKKILILIGLLLVIVIIVIFAMRKGTDKNSNQGAETSGSQIKTEKEAVKKPNANANFEVGSGVITPKAFMVEYPSDASLAVASSDNQAHDIVFDDPEVGIDHIAVGPGETKTVVFKTPKPGQYSLHCSVSGHQDKGEVASLIVSEMPKKQNPIVSFDKTPDGNNIPGASLSAAGGILTPNKFTVVSGSPVSLAVTSSDGQAHNVIFSSKEVGADTLQIGPNEAKSTVFDAPKAGEYDFYCNIPGHEKETGKMIVK